MAVPGHPTLPGAAGTNALLRDGAALVRERRRRAGRAGSGRGRLLACRAGRRSAGRLAARRARERRADRGAWGLAAAGAARAAVGARARGAAAPVAGRSLREKLAPRGAPARDRRVVRQGGDARPSVGARLPGACLAGSGQGVPATGLGVDPSRGFATEYRVLPARRRLLAALKEAAREAASVLLALDPDAEGESLARQLALELVPASRRGCVRRIVCRELTQDAVLVALRSPRDPTRGRPTPSRPAASSIVWSPAPCSRTSAASCSPPPATGASLRSRCGCFVTASRRSSPGSPPSAGRSARASPPPRPPASRRCSCEPAETTCLRSAPTRSTRPGEPWRRPRFAWPP